MTLVDTSVWVDHLRRSVPLLVHRLRDANVACHPLVIGELALGGLRRPAETIELLCELPQVSVSAHEDVLRFVAEHRLGASGIGWIDAHLLCAALNSRIPVWTRDRKLQAVAARLGLADVGT